MIVDEHCFEERCPFCWDGVIGAEGTIDLATMTCFSCSEDDGVLAMWNQDDVITQWPIGPCGFLVVDIGRECCDE